MRYDAELADLERRLRSDLKQLERLVAWYRVQDDSEALVDLYERLNTVRRVFEPWKAKG